MSDSHPPPAGPTKEQLKGALKAFKRRLKLTRLDAESQLSKNPLSTGRGSGIVAITPPAFIYPQVPIRNQPRTTTFRVGVCDSRASAGAPAWTSGWTGSWPAAHSPTSD